MRNIASQILPKIEAAGELQNELEAYLNSLRDQIEKATPETKSKLVYKYNQNARLVNVLADLIDATMEAARTFDDRLVAYAQEKAVTVAKVAESEDVLTDFRRMPKEAARQYWIAQQKRELPNMF